MTDLPLKDRIALVVGASRGIGYESALALARAGAHVIATARTQGGLEELDDAIFAATGQHATQNVTGHDFQGGLRGRSLIGLRLGSLVFLRHVAGVSGGKAGQADHRNAG